MKKDILVLIIITIFSIFFFSYKLLEVPTGLYVDESAMGYNAVLLSQTGRDENGRFMPFFVLSDNGTDWKQPITQYYLAFLFKIFGPSLFLLRFSSIIITIISLFIVYRLTLLLLNSHSAFFALFIFLTTPLIMIQSHLGLDNIMPIPFTLLWLLGFYLYTKTNKYKYLILAGTALGLSFYSYKGMRAVFPIWSAVSVLFIFYTHFKTNFIKTFRISIKPIIVFIVFSQPYFLISPLLNHLYPGSIFGGAKVKIDSVYNLLYPYLSSFDPTFLYIKGDDTLFHSTGYHGMFLLSSLPIFLIGAYICLKNSRFSQFLLVSFFTAPFLYGTVNSVHRASRLMCLIPIYALICSHALIFINQRCKKYRSVIVFSLVVLSLINYSDFAIYYWNKYPPFTQSLVGTLEPYQSFKKLKEISISQNLTPYIAQNISNTLFEAIYFPSGVAKIHEDTIPPPNSILMTNREHIDGMSQLEKTKFFYFQTTAK